MISVRTLLDRYNIHYEEDPSSSSELLILCPFHKDTAVGSAFFNEDDNVFYCFSCGSGGSIYDFVMKLVDCSWEESVKILEAEVDYETKKETIGNLVISGGKFDLEFKELRKAQVNAILNVILNGLGVVVPDRVFISKWLSILTYISAHTMNASIVSWKDIQEVYGEFLRESFLKDFKKIT